MLCFRFFEERMMEHTLPEMVHPRTKRSFFEPLNLVISKFEF
jgi:hypothetical protein